MTREEIEDKKLEIYKLVILLPQHNGQELVERFFDLESERMLDEKIRVLKEMHKRTPISKIKGFHDILEKFPKEKEGHTLYY